MDDVDPATRLERAEAAHAFITNAATAMQGIALDARPRATRQRADNCCVCCTT
jgi:hypothetical protein